MDPKLRFSSRVEDYARFRPRYPSALVPVLQEEIGLQSQWIIADIGSGTGISAEPFLDNGNAVLAVEPNEEMRGAALRCLGDRKGFQGIAGSAEATGLESESVHLVVAGQAFHWFHRGRARAEFQRILRRPRRVALFWNTRSVTGSAFAEGYEALLRRFGTDYEQVRHDILGQQPVLAFFADSGSRRMVPNAQSLDLAALEGLIRSTSYTPTPDDASFEAMREALRTLFEVHQVNGRVTVAYETEIFTGRLS